MESLESGSPRIASKKFRGSPARMFTAVTCVCFGPLTFGFSVGYSSPAIPVLEAVGLLDEKRTAWFGSLLTVGGMIGGPLAGWLIEKMGRKTTLMISSVLYIIGFSYITFASKTLDLYIGRFISGLATGQMAVGAAVYIAEVSTKSWRGFLGACNQLSITVGILLTYTLGISISWKHLAACGIAISSINFLALFFVPETPRWFLMKNRRQDALKSLATLRGPHEDVEDECRDIEEGLDSNSESISWQELYKAEYFRPLLIVLAVMAFQQFTGINAVMFYTVSIFNSAGFHRSQEATAFIGAVQVVATVLSCLLMDRSGRRKLLIISGSFMFLSCMTFGWYYYYTTGSKSDMGLGGVAITSLVIYIIGFSLGWGPVPMLVMSEIVPARVKGLASGISIFTSWGTAFIITKEFTVMQMILGPAGTFWFYGVCCLCSVMFINKYLPETKGKSLEDIELYFLGRSLG